MARASSSHALPAQPLALPAEGQLEKTLWDMFLDVYYQSASVEDWRAFLTAEMAKPAAETDFGWQVLTLHSSGVTWEEIYAIPDTHAAGEWGTSIFREWVSIL